MRTLFEQVEAHRVALADLSRETKALRSELRSTKEALTSAEAASRKAHSESEEARRVSAKGLEGALASVESRLQDLVVEQASKVAKSVSAKSEALHEAATKASKAQLETIGCTTEALGARLRNEAKCREEDRGKTRGGILRLEREVSSLNERLDALEERKDDALLAVIEAARRGFTRSDEADIDEQSSSQRRAQWLGRDLRAIVDERCGHVERRVEGMGTEMSGAHGRLDDITTELGEYERCFQDKLDELGEAWTRAAQRFEALEASDPHEASDRLETWRRELVDNTEAKIEASVDGFRRELCELATEVSDELCRAKLEEYDARHRAFVAAEIAAARDRRNKEFAVSVLGDAAGDTEEALADTLRAMVATCRRFKGTCENEVPALREQLAALSTGLERASKQSASVEAQLADVKERRQRELRSACDEVAALARRAHDAASETKALRSADLEAAKKHIRAACDELLVQLRQEHSACVERAREAVEATGDGLRKSLCAELALRVAEERDGLGKSLGVELSSQLADARGALERAVERSVKDTRSNIESGLETEMGRRLDELRSVIHGESEELRARLESVKAQSARQLQAVREESAKAVDGRSTDVDDLVSDVAKLSRLVESSLIDLDELASTAVRRPELEAESAKLSQTFQTAVDGVVAADIARQAELKARYNELSRSLTSFASDAVKRAHFEMRCGELSREIQDLTEDCMRHKDEFGLQCSKLEVLFEGYTSEVASSKGILEAERGKLGKQVEDLAAHAVRKEDFALECGKLGRLVDDIAALSVKKDAFALECGKLSRQVDNLAAHAVYKVDFALECGKLSRLVEELTATTVRKSDLVTEREQEHAELAALLAEARREEQDNQLVKLDEDAPVILSIHRKVDAEIDRTRRARSHFEEQLESIQGRLESSNQALFEACLDQQHKHADLVRRTDQLDQDCRRLGRAFADVVQGTWREPELEATENEFRHRDNKLACVDGSADISDDGHRYSLVEESIPLRLAALQSSMNTNDRMHRKGGQLDATFTDDDEAAELDRERRVTIALQEGIRSGQLLSHITSELQSIAAS